MITGWRDERTDRMNTDTTEKQPVADCVSQSALIRRCKALLPVLIGLAAGYFCYEIANDRNWMEAVKLTYFSAITLLAVLMIPFR